MSAVLAIAPTRCVGLSGTAARDVGLECLELAEEPVVLGVRDLGRVVYVVGVIGALDCSRKRATCSTEDMGQKITPLVAGDAAGAVGAIVARRPRRLRTVMSSLEGIARTINECV